MKSWVNLSGGVKPTGKDNFGAGCCCGERDFVGVHYPRGGLRTARKRERPCMSGCQGSPSRAEESEDWKISARLDWSWVQKGSREKGGKLCARKGGEKKRHSDVVEAQKTVIIGDAK